MKILSLSPSLSPCLPVCLPLFVFLMLVETDTAVDKQLTLCDNALPVITRILKQIDDGAKLD